MAILYTTHCPKCEVLRKKLLAANIDFLEIDDINILAKKGIDIVPVLEVNNELMSFSSAIEWIKTR